MGNIIFQGLKVIGKAIFVAGIAAMAADGADRMVGYTKDCEEFGREIKRRKEEEEKRKQGKFLPW